MMDFGNIKIRFQRDWSTRSWDVYFIDNRNFHYKYKITIERTGPVEEGRHLRAEPALTLDIHDFEVLLPAVLEGLSEAGFLATKPGDLAHVEALKYHLEDMRRLAFMDTINEIKERKDL